MLLLTSLTIQMAQRAFKERQMPQVSLSLLSLTAVGGVIFVGMQYRGFEALWAQHLYFTNSVAVSFLYIIFGLHAVHVLGGIIALLILFFRAFSTRSRNYSPVPVEIVSTYWHFVDLLWLYVLVFFLWIQ